jgi:hypothetical protein
VPLLHRQPEETWMRACKDAADRVLPTAETLAADHGLHPPDVIGAEDDRSLLGVWYAEQAGFRPIDWDQLQLEPGDFLATLHDEDLQPLRSRMRLDLVRSDSGRPESADLFCTMNGFYAVSFTEFIKGPWQVTTRCINTIDLYRAAS